MELKGEEARRYEAALDEKIGIDRAEHDALSRYFSQPVDYSVPANKVYMDKIMASIEAMPGNRAWIASYGEEHDTKLNKLCMQLRSVDAHFDQSVMFFNQIVAEQLIPPGWLERIFLGAAACERGKQDVLKCYGDLLRGHVKHAQGLMDKQRAIYTEFVQPLRESTLYVGTLDILRGRYNEVYLKAGSCDEGDVFEFGERAGKLRVTHNIAATLFSGYRHRLKRMQRHIDEAQGRIGGLEKGSAVIAGLAPRLG